MKTCLLLVILSVIQLIAFPQHKRILLYPQGAPGAKETPADYKETTDSSGYIYKVSQPELICFYPEQRKANGTAVVICPGGGYQLVVASDEGSAVAKAFNEIGVTAFVLKYRLPSENIMNDKTIGPLQDAQMALRTVRERAKEWNLHADKIGIVGLSAGGHLASTAGTHFTTSFIDNPQKISLRPDFMILIYPVITLGPEGSPRTRTNLIGKDPPAELIAFFSNETHVTPETPPTFLIHATDDKFVSVQNSLLFYNALKKANVKTELHLFQNGGHGFGVDHPTRKNEWLTWCAAWMKENGF